MASRLSFGPERARGDAADSGESGRMIATNDGP